MEISVLMAVHNGGGDLGRTLDSLERALPPECEVVVVDDGSTDDTPERLEARRDLPLVVIRQERAGQTLALNRGLAQCRGRLVARLDCGDFCHPQRLLLQRQELDARPDLLLVGCRVRRLDLQGRLLGVSEVVRDSARLERGLLRINLFQHSSLMIRTQVLREVGGYRPFFRFSQDLDLLLRISERGKLGNLDQALSDWVLDPHSVSFRHRRSQAAFADIARACARARRRGDPDPVEAGRCSPPALDVEPEDRRLAHFHLETARALLMGGQGAQARWELGQARRLGLPVRRTLLPLGLSLLPEAVRKGLRTLRVLWLTR